jgi:CheY-like chemotaxis protein
MLTIAPLANEALRLVRAMLPATIEIQQEIRSDGAIFADPTHIHQILLNLSTNAFHAMKDRGGVLAFSLDDVVLEEPLHLDGQIMRAGPCVKLTVSDTGNGIPEELRHRIFEPYFTTKTSGEGTGLGLATVRGIVQDHGGLVTYTSTLGEGTRFELYFPRIEGSIPESLIEASDVLAHGQGHVLLVDDELDLTELVGEMLEGLGYQVTRTNNPLEALELFRAGPESFNIVITDMSMPKMTGELLSQELIGLRPDTPIILCTGYGEALVREQAFASGVRKILTKPFKLKELAKALHDLA